MSANAEPTESDDKPNNVLGEKLPYLQDMPTSLSGLPTSISILCDTKTLPPGAIVHATYQSILDIVALLYSNLISPPTHDEVWFSPTRSSPDLVGFLSLASRNADLLVSLFVIMGFV
ncbi:hypothetical protein VTO42DRAFT_1336 [Malbranchea cinnamomea]